MIKKYLIVAGLVFGKFSVHHVYAQTPHIKWFYNTNDASFGQSAAADLDGDGKLEMVFGCYRNDSSVYALNAEDGSLLWKVNTHPKGAEGCNDVAPIIYDVDGDKKPEVIVPSSCNPTTFCFDGKTGAIKWTCPTRGSDSPPTIADLDGDGKPEILHGEFGGYVLCINAEDGSKAWELKVDSNSWIQTAPTIVDLNGDGQLDFVVGTWNFNKKDSIYAYTGNTHKRLWSYPVHDYMYHGSAVADLDNDGKPELVIGSYNDTLYCLNGENGTLDWKYFSAGGYVGAPATIGDVDNDGTCDVVFVGGYKVTALTNKGKLKWSYTIPGYDGAFRGVALSDINNDKFPDVIFGSDKGKVYALNGNDGSLIWMMDLAAHYGNKDFSLDHAPLIADFDGDDSLDVFIVGGHAEYPAFNKDFGRAYMFTAGKGNGPDWLMFQHDIRRQSALSTCAFQTGILDEGNNETAPSIKVFPNPSYGFVSIQYSNPNHQTHTLLIYNSEGKLIQKMDKLSGNEIQFENKGWKKGIYFFQLMNEGGRVGEGKFGVGGN